MTTSNETTGKASAGKPTHKVRIPGFITGEDVGLGEVIKRATTLAGIRPCEPCRRRAAGLDRWMVFTGRR
jgi:hypothetical protein